MVEMGLRLVLSGVLAGAALAKLAQPSAGREALAGLGFESPVARAIGFWSLIAVEMGLAVTVVAGSTEGAILGAALMAMFGFVMASAIARGRARAPCGCFGARSRIGWTGVARNFVLAAGFAAVAVLPSDDLSTDHIPGSPHAVALDPQGTVLAKGTFNSLAQLESILAAGERRRGG